MRFAYIAVVCILTALSIEMGGQEQEAAILSGHVYTYEGLPLAHALVDVFPLEAAVSGAMPHTETDDQGAYRLRSPAFGKTRICGSFERLGYPDTRDKVFAAGSETFPEVQLTAGARLEGVDIRLGPPDGILRGEIVDWATQLPVRLARIDLRWAEDPSVMFAGTLPPSGEFEFALPKRPIRLNVVAPGYRSWTYSQPQSQAASFEMTPGEHIFLKIELNKLAPAKE